MNDAAALRTQDIGTVHDQFFTLRDFPVADGTVMPEARSSTKPMAARTRRAQRRAGYPRLYRQPPFRRPQSGQWQPAGLVGWADRSRQGDRHRQIVRCRLEHAGLVLWLDQCREPQPGDRQTLRPGFSGDRHPRHRHRAEGAARIRSGSSTSSRSPAPLMADIRRFSGPSPIPASWTRSCRSIPRPGLRSIPTSSSPSSRRGSQPTRNGMAGVITDRCGAVMALTEIRIETLKRYGIEANLASRYPDPAEREAAIRQQAANWARNWDAHSLIILRRALLGFDTRPISRRSRPRRCTSCVAATRCFRRRSRPPSSRR